RICAPIRNQIQYKSRETSCLGNGVQFRLLFSTGFVPTSYISPSRLADLERTAENALLTPQKVGRTTENVLSPLFHMDILTPCGYFYH
ncbi:MAG: hypothetical protein COV07_01530, partial [Candidatus Vogelbacteria bacterium CG10_big_fil_rev_8_21_14_0_10_45_14]